MRKTFIETLCALAASDERIVLLTADLGWGFLSAFEEAFPDRYHNVGVAEQNMVGVATGMAEAGYVPFCYSITPFATLRPLEFIRNGPCLHRLPVRIVGTGQDRDYLSAGPSHWADGCNEIMRALGGIEVVVPTSKEDVVASMNAYAACPGPVYFNLAKG